MRRIFLIVLTVLAASAALAWLMQLDAGYVLIEFHGTTIESTIWVALLLLVLGLVVLRCVGMLIGALAYGWARLRGRRPKRSLFKSLRLARGSHTARGALAFQEGRWKQAVRLLARGARDSDAPVLNYLLAARASLGQGDAVLAEGFLELAAETPGASAAVAIARAEAQLSAQRPTEALKALESAALNYDDHPAAMRLLLEALERLGEWARIASVLPQARRQQVLPQTLLDALEERCYRSLLPLAAKDRKALQTTWNGISNPVREYPSLMVQYATLLDAVGAGDDAAQLLRAALKQQWQGALVDAYGRLVGADPRQQLKTAESWLDKRGNDAALLLALGRIALRNRLWGKARDYFEGSFKLSPTAECAAELARLCMRLGEGERSLALLQRALQSEIGELPALPLPDSTR